MKTIIAKNGDPRHENRTVGESADVDSAMNPPPLLRSMRHALAKRGLTSVLLLAAATQFGGCAVVAVASTAIDVGVTAGSMAVGAVTTVGKGVIGVGSAVAGSGSK